MTLSEFLLARIQEDEARARQVFREYSASLGGTLEYTVYQVGVDDRHLAVSPDRLAAECEAKREIVEAYERVSSVEGDRYSSGWRDGVAAAMAQLAEPYYWHPDYEDGWRRSG